MNFTELQHPLASPLQRLTDERWDTKGVQLYIKRDDLLAPDSNDPFCGNKWRKLQYNLLRAQAEGHQQLLTFGGAYSNHLAAVASAGKHLGFDTIGIVRGEAVQNATLERAQQDGMQLHFVDRTTYRQKHEPLYLQQLIARFGKSYILPEGGTNAAAYPGCAGLTHEIMEQCSTPPTHIALACGTGGTMAGVISGLPEMSSIQVLGVSVLKGDFMRREVQQQLTALKQANTHWQVLHQYHHGGYARQRPELMAFIQDFYAHHATLLEPIYTGKLFYALYDLLAQDYFPKGSKVVGIHTGGLQSFGCRV